MSALADILKRRIAQNGPIPLADYMAECLLHPEHGYYTTRAPFGTKGDFITAPEISQMFGELLGLCLAQSWLDQGAPAPFTLAEVGPGRGTLMADVLRATKSVPGFHAAAQITLIEASPRLKQVQRDTLAAYHITHCPDLAALPEQPLFLLANEFFDALPIRQFTRDAQGWRETMVGMDGDALALGLSAPAPIRALDHRLSDTSAGDIVEVCPAAAGHISALSQRIVAHGGVALIFDYGGWHSLGDTFQALEDHHPVDPLARPGHADLTAHVDFEPLAVQARREGAQASALMTQGEILGHLGIVARAQALAMKLQGDALEAHVAAFNRLTSPQEMGSLFKTIALFPQHAPCPAGYDA
ncbi:hypothetical protein AQS8620_00548 [Aquimixticola soesokkakensis]|uniref:SAM-dependent methyltransferase n=1 Tax=Aquimixticola soesokkakensis TaxID=1519096 RepID=A0A1Y5RME5_9RHOB|nr:SAM-dependent methyltransferase [Aquimixticola soesokkakensis]SLN20703.1 hypothetical protein AQS8620_00548 [Aquimixticola soesokkakensis]